MRRCPNRCCRDSRPTRSGPLSPSGRDNHPERRAGLRSPSGRDSRLKIQAARQQRPAGRDNQLTSRARRQTRSGHDIRRRPSPSCRDSRRPSLSRRDSRPTMRAVLQRCPAGRDTRRTTQAGHRPRTGRDTRRMSLAGRRNPIDRDTRRPSLCCRDSRLPSPPGRLKSRTGPDSRWEEPAGRRRSGRKHRGTRRRRQGGRCRNPSLNCRDNHRRRLADRQPTIRHCAGMRRRAGSRRRAGRRSQLARRQPGRPRSSRPACLDGDRQHCSGRDQSPGPTRPQSGHLPIRASSPPSVHPPTSASRACLEGSPRWRSTIILGQHKNALRATTRKVTALSGKDVRRRPTLPPSPPGSTIGAEGLNFRVRNGAGCFPFAMATETLWRCQERAQFRRPEPGARPHLGNRTVDAKQDL